MPFYILKKPNARINLAHLQRYYGQVNDKRKANLSPD